MTTEFTERDKQNIERYEYYIREYRKTVLELRTGSCYSVSDAESLGLAKVFAELEKHIRKLR